MLDIAGERLTRFCSLLIWPGAAFNRFSARGFSDGLRYSSGVRFDTRLHLCRIEIVGLPDSAVEDCRCKSSIAIVAELADAHGSGPCTGNGVGVRVPSMAPKIVLVFFFPPSGPVPLPNRSTHGLRALGCILSPLRGCRAVSGKLSEIG
jgi:hypothetical protein